MGGLKVNKIGCFSEHLHVNTTVDFQVWYGLCGGGWVWYVNQLNGTDSCIMKLLNLL